MVDLMTLEEVASYLRVTKKTVYRLLERHAIPSTKVGHLWRFDRNSIDAWLHQNAGTKASILVIDDDPSILALFKDALEGAGHMVQAAGDPSRGLELATHGDFGLVFLDLKMPGMDGAELLKRIRLVKPQLPVTIITGYPDGDAMAKALEHGPFGVMSKPFRASDIMTVVNSYLRFGEPAVEAYNKDGRALNTAIE